MKANTNHSQTLWISWTNENALLYYWKSVHFKTKLLLIQVVSTVEVEKNSVVTFHLCLFLPRPQSLICSVSILTDLHSFIKLAQTV